MNIAYLSLGSNIGNRLDYLKKAVKLLNDTESIIVNRVSSVYETDPVGYEEQAPFLNIAVELETSLTPHELLKQCNRIEAELGRTRDIRWGPRTVDLDILLYNEEILKTEDLIIPHPRMTERGFVLIPLVELNPGLVEPLTKHSLLKLAYVQKEGVHKWKMIDGVDAFVHFDD